MAPPKKTTRKKVPVKKAPAPKAPAPAPKIGDAPQVELNLDMIQGVVEPLGGNAFVDFVAANGQFYFDQYFRGLYSAEDFWRRYESLYENQQFMEQFNVWSANYGGGGELPPEPPPPFIPTDAQQSLIDEWRGIFLDSGFTEADATSLVAFITQGLTDGWDETKVVRELQKTPTFDAYVPEVRLRKEGNLVPMPIGEIMAERKAVQEVSRHFGGHSPTLSEQSAFIGGGGSAAELRSRIDTYDRVKKLGGAVKQFFSLATSTDLDDEELFEFFNPAIKTPELDKQYRNAVAQQYFKNIGFNMEVGGDLLSSLEQRGFDPDQLQQEYRQLGTLLPGIERWAHLNRSIADDPSNPYDSFATAFKASLLGDQEASNTIARWESAERARWTGTGGIAGGGQGSLSREERRRRGIG